MRTANSTAINRVSFYKKKPLQHFCRFYPLFCAGCCFSASFCFGGESRFLRGSVLRLSGSAVGFFGSSSRRSCFVDTAQSRGTAQLLCCCLLYTSPADRTDDPFLVEKMCAELEGILLWCLEGLHRLVQNNFRFTVSPKAAANVDTIKRSSNNVIDFMESEGYFRFKADYSISSKDFYEIYKLWCEDNACHSVSAIRFSAELRQNDRRYNLEATNNIYLPGGRRVRGFVGIEPLVHPCP